MANHPRRKRTVDIPSLVQIERPAAADRAQAEQFVRDAFSVAYTARVRQLMPTLMTLRHDSGRLLAVLGLREPDATRFYLEHYLDRPVEQVLSEVAGCPVDRAALIEVGNFAVGAAGGGRWLITALTAYLFTAQKTWAVFTCGPELQNAFRRLGIDLVELAPADPARLPSDEIADWGTYYDQRPKVMAASVAQSHQVLSGLYGKECTLHALWRQALQAGRVAA